MMCLGCMISTRYSVMLIPETAELRLKDLGQGAFLIRESKSTPGSYTLAVNHNDAIMHMKITNEVASSMRL